MVTSGVCQAASTATGAPRRSFGAAPEPRRRPEMPSNARSRLSISAFRSLGSESRHAACASACCQNWAASNASKCVVDGLLDGGSTKRTKAIAGIGRDFHSRRRHTRSIPAYVKDTERGRLGCASSDHAPRREYACMVQFEHAHLSYRASTYPCCCTRPRARWRRGDHYRSRNPSLSDDSGGSSEPI